MLPSALATSTERDHDDRSHADRVVLVHGLVSHSLLLRPLELRLRKSNYRTFNWGYQSVVCDISKLSHAFALYLRRLAAPDNARIHVVTHSMGGIIARAAMISAELPQLGNVVMLAPPHHGSRVAARLAGPLGWFCKPLRQLSDDPQSYVNRLYVPDGFHVGIIAAARDRVVSVESTHLAGCSEHVVVQRATTRS